MTKYLYYLIPFLLLSSCNKKFKELEKESNKFNVTTEILLADNNHVLEIEQLYKKGKEGYFFGEDSINIYFKIFKQQKAEKGAILISSGRTEAAIKYKELIFDLYKNGYSIYILDHRGQGLSDRMTEDPDMGYIDNFQFYINDLKYFYENYLLPKRHEKIFLLAHSMGGAIGVTYLEQFPNDFNAAAFSSPMLGLKIPICTAVKLLVGEEIEYAIGETNYQDENTEFEENTLTGSKIRYTRMIEAYEQTPKAKLGGATYQWINKSCIQFDSIFNNIEKIQTPFILFSAENEEIVAVSAHQKFVERAKELNKKCQAYLVDNAQHELFIEKDEQRIETINKTLLFYELY